MEVAGEEPSLQEALQFVDNWDIDIAALFGLDDALSPAVPPPARPPSKVRRATVERTELREELQQLQQHLESSSHVTPHAVGTLANEWREIAARQREQRLAADVDNRKLHEVVESQLKFAHKTATLLKKVQQIDTALGSERAASIETYRGPHVAILDSQLTRLNGLAVEARTIFSSGRFAAPMRQEVRDVAFHNLGQEGLLIELAVSWVLPFTVDRVVDVLWVHTTRMPRTERTICLKDIYTTEDTLVSQFVSEAKTLGTIQSDLVHPAIGATHGQIATRRGPIGTDGSVLVISCMDVRNIREDGTCKSVLQGDGLLLVEPVEASNRQGEALCRVKWSRRVLGVPPDTTSAESMADFARWAQSFTSPSMRNKWWRSIDSHLQAVENMLLA